jgi:hypothetical protein
MGYILPIQQHEYSEYQKRIGTNKRTIETVEKPYKVILKANYEELRHEGELRSEKHSPVIHVSDEKETQLPDIDEIYTELTGLGIYVNEKV